MPRRRRSPREAVAHYGAPVAFLAGITIAVLLVHSALSGHGTTSTTTQTTIATPTTTKSTNPPRKTGAKQYVVQSGDTFGSIAAKEGISVARLQALNPGVSSNALQVGQKLRIR
jgi:LysM repeat protein